MLVAAAQMRLSADLEVNEQKILHWARNAAELSIKIVNFPETALTGYLFEGFKTVDMPRVEACLGRLHQAAQDFGVSLLIGAPQQAGEQGPLYNSIVALLSDSRQLVYHKMHLVAAENAWFVPGPKPLCFDLEGHKLGVMICRDQSHPALAAELADQGARIIFLCSAHYYSLPEARLKQPRNLALPLARAVENRSFVCKANAVGWNRGLISLGNSVIFNPDGITVQRSGESQEELLVCECDLDAKALWAA